MIKDQATQLLKSINMSVTDSRRQILELFFDNRGGALKHGDIEKKLEHLDRVTIYRSLQTFTEKGIIHSIPGSDGTAKYALCHERCSEGHHHDNHVHFHCRECGITQCLDEVTVPFVKVPKGFLTDRIEMVVSGYCNKCSQSITNLISSSPEMA